MVKAGGAMIPEKTLKCLKIGRSTLYKIAREEKISNVSTKDLSAIKTSFGSLLAGDKT